MTIDLKKYDGRYVEILYGPNKIIGKLSVGEEVKVKNFSSPTREEIDYYSAWDYIRDYVGHCSAIPRDNVDEFVYVESEITINERNINALKDITEKIYSRLNSHKEDREEQKNKRGEFLSYYEQKLEFLKELYKGIPTTKGFRKRKERRKLIKRIRKKVKDIDMQLLPGYPYYEGLGVYYWSNHFWSNPDYYLDRLAKQIEYTKNDIEKYKRDVSNINMQIERIEQLKKDIEQLKE